VVDQTLEPRINQIYSPLSAVMEDPSARADLRGIARHSSAILKTERSASMDAQVVTVIRYLLQGPSKGGVGVGEIAEVFSRTYGKEHERQVTSRSIGQIVRRKLNLTTQKSNGVFVIPVSERPKLEALFERYGVSEQDARSVGALPIDVGSVLNPAPVDFGDFGDVGTAPQV
jgi:hypothetical protein